jgi:hypothetical protein
VPPLTSLGPARALLLVDGRAASGRHLQAADVIADHQRCIHRAGGRPIQAAAQQAVAACVPLLLSLAQLGRVIHAGCMAELQESQARKGAHEVVVSTRIGPVELEGARVQPVELEGVRIRLMELVGVRCGSG